MEAIILAGGKGTRLRSVISELPKPMAPINDRPFLEYVIDSLERGGVDRIVLSVGYRHESIVDHFRAEYRGVRLDYSIEDEPLGTGGAIKAALARCNDEYVFVLNGDTFFDVDYRKMFDRTLESTPDLMIAVKELENFDRYGRLEIVNGRVERMREKEFCAKGFINGGVYCLKRDLLDGVGSEKFSFERDFLERFDGKILAFESLGYFIDIGIPSDYERARLELKNFISEA